MKLTEQDRLTAQQSVAQHWAAKRWLTDESQKTLSAVIAQEVERELGLAEPCRSEVERRVLGHPAVKNLPTKGLIPLLIFGAIVSWIIGRALDAIFDKYVHHRVLQQGIR